MKLRDEMLKTAIQHADGEIQLHKMNVEVYLTTPAGIGEHPDVMEAMEKELDIVAKYDDQIEMLKKYFKKE